MISFFGSFHPVIVHLPIGILLVAILFEWLSNFTKYRYLENAVAPLFLGAAITAIAACLTGYWLSANGEYDPTILSRHKWMGIITAIVTTTAWLLKKEYFNFGGIKIIYRTFCILLFLLIIITGHLGGTLTHGSGFLTKNLPEYIKSGLGIQTVVLKEIPITNVQEAKLYDDLVMRIINKKCISCHGPEKQKGKLRLDGEEFILKGGKEGPVIDPGSPEGSELIKRIILPLNDEDHMPPKEKQQLTPDEVALLHWWIKSGPDFKRKVMEIAQTDSIKSMLMTFQSNDQTITEKEFFVPKTPVVAARQTLVDSLRKSGILLEIVDPANNYLSANFINTIKNIDTLLLMLSGIDEQLLMLKISNKVLSDSSLRYVGALQQLRRLYLNGTNVNDTTIAQISQLQHLEYLNLVGTKLTYRGLESIKDLKSLKSLYLFGTSVSTSLYKNITQLFPKATIDTGGYLVPIFASDTTIYKNPKKKQKKAD